MSVHEEGARVSEGFAVEVAQRHLDLLATCAVRYALGRMTSVVGEVREAVEHTALSPEALRQIWADLDRQISRDTDLRGQGIHIALPLGMDVDRESWLALREHLKNRLEAL